MPLSLSLSHLTKVQMQTQHTCEVRLRGRSERFPHHEFWKGDPALSPLKISFREDVELKSAKEREQLLQDRLEAIVFSERRGEAIANW